MGLRPPNPMKNRPSRDYDIGGFSRPACLGQIWVLNRFGESWPEMRRKPGTDTNFRRSLPEFGCLSQGLPNGTGCLFVVSPKRLSTRDRTALRAYSAMDATICGRRLVPGHTHCAVACTARAAATIARSD